MADLLNCLERMYKCRDQIAAFPTGRIKIDLQKMYRSVTLEHRNVNSLWVDCRRTQRISSEYTQALEQYQESVTNLEQYLLLAHLIKDN